MKPLLRNILIVGLVLGTAWAVRGKFGHEQGAAWAGAIGALSILLLAKREDWNAKFLKATLAAAIGWGLGGMMSYGLVVGYGKGLDFGNVYYGLTMLFVIGGLYGYMGGGLLGLALADSPTQPICWGNLVSGMTASGALAYFFLVMQWEWLMTPPRSELWAVCLGGVLFLTWFMQHHRQSSALRIATFTGLGGGFGFAFGNFLNVIGIASGIEFSFWNVMEYSLGFFGGLGMAYGTFTSDWKVTYAQTSRTFHLTSWFILVIFIPLVIWDQSFNLERLEQLYGARTKAAYTVQYSAMGLLILQALYTLGILLRKEEPESFSQNEIHKFFFVFFSVYILLSFLKTGTPIYTQLPEQYLYLLNLVGIFLLVQNSNAAFNPKSPTYGWRLLFVCLVLLALLATILIYSHGELPNTPKRFGQ
ncbi:MAG: hypothetical protein AAF694_22860 [Bacteroidota bacterium]